MRACLTPFRSGYRNLRRITSGTFKGQFFDPADPDISMVDLLVQCRYRPR